MSRKSKAADAMKKQKEARQKKILIALAPVLLGLLVWQGPGVLSAFSGGEAAPPPVMAPEGGESAPSADGGLDPATGAAPTTAAAGTPAVADPAATPASLPDTTDAVSPGPGQLVSFERFLGKDPFRQQVTVKDAPSGGGGTTDPPPGGGTTDPPPGDGGGRKTDPPPGDGDPPPAPPPPPGTYESAVIEVNGVQQTVAKRGTFPSFDPVFRLLGIRRGSIEFGLVTGAFAQGHKRITVQAGKSVTLVSQPDGQRFVIRLVAVG